LIPIARDGSSLTVAMAEPWNLIAVDDIKFLTGANVTIVLATISSIRHAIEHFYNQAEKSEQALLDLDDLAMESLATEPSRVLAQETHSVNNMAVPADQVIFTITSPAVVHPGISFVLDVWAHLERQRDEVIRRAREAHRDGEIQTRSKGPLHVSRGTVLSVRLKVEGLTIADAEDTILWEGQIGNATFLVTVPQDATTGTRGGLATIHIEGFQIARIYFVLQVANVSLQVDRLPAREERHRKAFVSYASADRDEVLPRLQGIQKALPALDIFLDVLSLRSGQYWEQELWKVIPPNDVFYLFWSANAQKSEWVEKEWRCALQARGLDFIDPVPLVSPEEIPPPPELAEKHFNDWVLAFMRRRESGL
jgi:hypothetical protein